MKTIAEECGVDLSQFSGGGKERRRTRKRKLNGQEISVPSNPTCKRIKEDISRMITSGKLTLGKPCVVQAVWLGSTRWMHADSQAERDMLSIDNVQLFLSVISSVYIYIYKTYNVM